MYSYKVKVRAASSIKLSSMPNFVNALEKAVSAANSKRHSQRMGYSYIYLGPSEDDDYSVVVAFSCRSSISVTRAVASSLTRVLIDKDLNLLTDSEIAKLKYNNNLLKCVIVTEANDLDKLEQMLPTDVLSELLRIFCGPGCQTTRAIEFQDQIKKMVIDYLKEGC